MVVEWSTANSALAGTSGDVGVVVEFTNGALAAVIDGLGHGEEARAAAVAAERILVESPSGDVSELVRRCHEALRGTRGAVMSVASFNAPNQTMTWVGVGNVEGLLVRMNGPDEAIAMRGGTLGYMLPPLNPRTLHVKHGDTLVLASDGIRHGFKHEVLQLRTPGEIVAEVMAHFAKTSDDACVVVARYVGEAAA